MVNPSQRLELMREAGHRACEKILEVRSDIITIYIVGSVARGDIHGKSDLDVVAVKEQGDYEEERMSSSMLLGEVKESGFSIDIFYIPRHLWEEELYHSWGSEWEVEASSIVDALILYDPKGIMEKAKQDFKSYPVEMRRRSIENIFNRLRNFGEAVWYHYVNTNYDAEAIFSKFYAMEALRILFPINHVYLKADKYIFKQLEQLERKPPNYLEKCLDLLWFKSQNVNHDEATWIINTVSETRKAIENEIRSLGLLEKP